MAYTLFNYLYRDADNYKAFGVLALDGEMTEGELKSVRSFFSGDGLFIAEQIRVPALQGKLHKWSNGPTSADHCWHEFMGVNVISETDVPADAYYYGRTTEFMARLFLVGEWNEELSPQFRLVVKRAG
jgi:hypothetical protein